MSDQSCDITYINPQHYTQISRFNVKGGMLRRFLERIAFIRKLVAVPALPNLENISLGWNNAKGILRPHAPNKLPHSLISASPGDQQDSFSFKTHRSIRPSAGACRKDRREGKMALPFQNVYIHRKVAEASSKPCMICFRPSTSVLITSCQKDFFYICPSHLNDRGFATAVVDEAAEAEKRKKEEMEKELEKIKQEFEEKQKRKEEKKKDKDKDKKEKEKAKTKDEEEEKKIKVEEAEKAKAEQAVEAPSFSEYNLHRNFFNIRQQKYLEKQIAKRNMERLKNPLSFPAVPRGDPV
ncbi:hypothetical protein TWF481_009976 [Arthrobotrys musiformis]|uniref:DUF1742-domain-containing protein n=1 Tax=Arthrobotrys musiformis TaxID=47236 RepID=A0AAV9W1H5_9PEZI